MQIQVLYYQLLIVRIYIVRHVFNYLTHVHLLPHMLFVCFVLFYATATVFQLYLCVDMMYEMRRRKPKPTLLLTSRDL